jgi:hypothetical protein
VVDIEHGFVTGVTYITKEFCLRRKAQTYGSRSDEIFWPTWYFLRFRRMGSWSTKHKGRKQVVD